MFEGLVASLLNRYLSDYIDEVDYNNLKLGIFSGTLELLNIKIKPSAMYQFDLPIDVKCGKIGKLKINVSWRNILTKPAVAEVEDVFVLLGPFEDKINDPKRIEELSLAHKKKQLQEFEKLDKREIVESKEKGYAEKVQDTIINNIQVYVRNVHIRYEDKHSLKGRSISFGVYMKEFKAETVDEDGKPNFSNADAKIIFKLGSLTGFNIYWNCDFGESKDSLITVRDDFNPKKDDWSTKMKESIDTQKILSSKFEIFMKNNLDLDTRLTIRRSYDKEDMKLPRITFQSSVKAIEFVFMRVQYKSILELLDHYSMLNLHKKYVKFRPRQDIKDKKQKCKLWWNFAFTAHAETTWRMYRKDRMLHHFKNYKLYLKKYENKLRAQINGKPLDQKELDYLEMLEKDLLLESIFDVRNTLMDKLKINSPEQIDRSDIKSDAFDRPIDFIQFRLILNFPLISLKLKNAGYDILCLKLRTIVSRFDVKPVQNSVYFLLNTRGVDLLGVHYKDNLKSGDNRLVPIIKSKRLNDHIGDEFATIMPSEYAEDMLFVFCFETNPSKYENAEFSVRTKVSAVEIYYEKTSITELLRFFKSDLIDFTEVKKIKEVWSKAGVIYAVENHKQFHVKAELSSPYFIIPVKGTCSQPCDSIVFFLGNTLVQSEVQSKLTNYTPESVEDLEKKFYDKLSMSVSEVQVLYVPETIDWKDYLDNYTKLNYSHHLLYPVSTKNNLYLSINPSYKKLPKLKLEADISSIRLNFSDDKIIQLFNFSKNFPLPEVPKSSSPVSPSPSTTNNVPVKKVTEKDDGMNNLFNLKHLTNEIEPDDEWNGPFNLPKFINGDPIPNYSQIACQFNIADFSIDLNEKHSEYLKFIFNSIKIDFVVAKYGIHFRAGLGDLKLIDKKHESPVTRENFAEILSSSTRDSNEIIRFFLRQVDQDAPNFASLYNKILTNILFDCSNIHVKCHRTAIVYSLKYFKSITDRFDQNLEEIVEKNKSNEIVVKQVAKISNLPDDVCEFNLIAKMNELTWDMFDANVAFGNMVIKQLSVSFNMLGFKTDLKVQLKKILINYGDETNQMSEFYRQIISCTGDGSNRQFFDFNVVLYDEQRMSPNEKNTLKLNVGKIKIICLVKFVNELLDFIDPILNPLPSALTEQVKEQAYEAVKNAYQEAKSESGRKIYLDIHITSPQVIIPQNSHSLDGFLVDLGTLNVTNEFLNIPTDTSCIQKMNLELVNLEMKRVFYRPNGNYFCDVKENVTQPISLTCSVLIPVVNNEPYKHPDMDIYLQMKDVEFKISLKTARLLFAILDENLNEGANKQAQAVKELAKKDEIKKLDEIKPLRDRISMKMNIDLQQIKLIIIEFKKKPNKRFLDSKSTSNDDSSNYLSAASKTAFSSYEDSDASGKSSMSRNLANQSMFSHFEIQSIVFKYLKNENSSWRADLNMRSLVLNDVRPDSNLAVKEMFVSSKEQDFIQVVYKFEAPGNADLYFTLDNLKINLCLPYVLKLYQIAMDAISNNKPKPDLQVTIRDKRNQPVEPVPEPVPEPKPNSSLKVFGKINLKEIALFAQPEKLNSQVLIMNAELIIRFESINSSSNLEIDLIKLGLRLGEHNSKRQGIPFLSPCQAKVTMCQTDPKQPAQYKAEIDSLYFNMTQTLYEVVMGVVGSINQTGTETIKNQTEKEKLLEDSEPFVKRRVDPADYDSYKKPENTDNQSNVMIIEKEDPMKKVTELLDLKIGKAYITFCEETSFDLQPLAIVKLQLEGRVANWSKNLHTKASMTFEASYYNDILSNWEPLIEYIMHKEDDYRPWILSLWFAMEPGGILQPSIEVKGIPVIDFPIKDLEYPQVEQRAAIEVITPVTAVVDEHDETKTKKRKKFTIFKKKEKDENKEEFELEQEPEPEVDQTKKASYILIESNDLLNINLTPSAYKVIMYLAEITSGSSKVFMESKVKPPLKFLNFLGEKSDLILNPKNYVKPEDAVGFNLKFGDSLGVKQGEDDPNQRIEKIVLNSQRSQIDTVYNESYKFVFSLPNFEKCRVSMKNDGSFLFPLRESNEPNDEDSLLIRENIKYNVMYKVRTLYGRRKIIFSSPLQIENNTQINLYIFVEMNEKLHQHASKFRFYDQMEIDGKFYVAIFRLIPTKIFYVPLYFAYNCKIYAAPETKEFVPSQIFDLRGYNLRVEDYSDVTCRKLSDKSINDFNMLRKLSLNVKSHRNVMPAMHANYRVCLYTPIKLINSLPFQIRVDVDEGGQILFSPTLEPGDSLNLNLSLASLNSFKIHLNNYLNASWLGVVNLNRLNESNDENYKIEMTVAPTTEMHVTGKHLSLSVNFKKPNEFMFYCPYWLINKSGQPIQIKPTDSARTFDIPDDTILLFDYRYVDKKNKVRLTIKDGSLSAPFSLETVGTTGMVQCEDIRQTYNFLMRITMSNSSRTKLITFAPFLSIANQLDEEISIREWHKSSKHQNWITVDKTTEDSKPMALWPNFVGENKQVMFVIRTSDGRETQPFLLENPGRFVLIPKETKKKSNTAEDSFVENSSKIITVLISGGSQNPVTIVVRKYQYGDSVAKFINLCDDLHVSISNNNLTWNIEPFSSMFFVWPDLINRDLYWTVNTCTKTEPLKLTKSGNETFTFTVEKKENSILNNSEDHNENEVRRNLIKTNQPALRNVQVCCVSYLDDGQRIIVFTTDDTLAEVERKKEASNMEIFVAIRGIQLSIINNVNLEISTISIKESTSTWEIVDEDTIRVFTREYSDWLETLYGDYLFNVHSVESVKQNALINHYHLQSAEYRNEKFEFNFNKMKIHKPETGVLVRNYHPGLIVQYRTSINMRSIKCCLYKLQIDNQLPDSYFPIVFHKTPTRLIDESQLIPFMNLSVFTEQQNVTEIYRYFECILGEFHLKADKGFIYSIKDWYDAAIMTTTKEDQSFDLSDENKTDIENVLILVDEDKTMLDKINLDIKLTKEIMEYQNQTGKIKQSAHIRFEEFHLSPIVFNLSFSVNGEAHTDDKVVSTNAASDQIFNFFLESIGASLTEFKDVKFTFNQFDMVNDTKTWKEMYDVLFDHYKIQALHQAYVLILGLDVLGNPFGLVSDFSEGITDLFYDPLVKYLSGDNRADRVDLEFTTKIRMTINKTISSAAGSGSLITGSIGRVLATFTFDKEYKKKRQYKISKLSTSSLAFTVSTASKGVVGGLIYGVTGVVRKPIDEGKKGPKGVLTGLGKGFAGLFTKPIGSVFDGISLTLDGIKRFALSGSEPIRNVRLPRHLINDVSIFPYSEYQAEGYEILRDLQNDDIALDEYYWAHLFVGNKRTKPLLFITDSNIYKLKRTSTQILKQWKLIENYVPLHKITLSQIVPFDSNQSMTARQKKKLESSLMGKSFKDPGLQQLYVTFEKQTSGYKFEDDNTKIVILISDKGVCDWLNDKIQSAIKYYRELKNEIEIV